MRRADAQLPGVEPQIASGDAPHGADRLIVDDERWLRRRLHGPHEIRAVRIECLAALDWRVAKALDQRLAKLGRSRAAISPWPEAGPSPPAPSRGRATDRTQPHAASAIATKHLRSIVYS